jgi:hypothetical protein
MKTAAHYLLVYIYLFSLTLLPSYSGSADLCVLLALIAISLGKVVPKYGASAKVVT